MNISGDYSNNLLKNKIISILEQNGYVVKDHNTYLSFPAKWRNGNDETSVTYYLDSGQVIDWVSSEKFDTKELLKRVVNIKSEKDIDSFIKENDIDFSFIRSDQEIKQQKTFDKEIILSLIKDHSYLISRGISEKTASEFSGGVTTDEWKGVMKNRYIIPIFNSKKDIVGFTGRTLINSKRKYLHHGQKSNWVWPAHLNSKIINSTKYCILVESPICVMKLYDNGIKNVLCLFGLDVNLKMLNFLLKTVNKIVISTNNEPNNNNIGNNAALSLKNKLLRYFDRKNILIHLPSKKDFADMSSQEIVKWKEELDLIIK